MLQIMTAISEDVKTGNPVDSGHLTQIAEFLSGFADKCHHGKEESILFATLKDHRIPVLDTMLDALLSEHQSGRSLINELKQALGAYQAGNKVELGHVAA